MARKKKAKTLHDQIVELAQKEYMKCTQRFIPMYPWVLVRILPKEQQAKSGLFLPESQNKVLYEAIVLETWRPRLVNFLDEDGHSSERIAKSQLVPGDHIVFPHWDGFPAEFLGLHIKTHRFIREVIWDSLGGVPFKIENDKFPTEKLLLRFLKQYSGDHPDYVVQQLLEKFNVIPRGQVPVIESVR